MQYSKGGSEWEEGLWSISRFHSLLIQWIKVQPAVQGDHKLITLTLRMGSLQNAVEGGSNKCCQGTTKNH